ncbi:MAG: hypothetical protein ACTTJ6_07495 [Treponema sp.]
MEYFLEPNEFFVGDPVQFYFCLPEGFTYKEFSIDKIRQNTSMTINDVSIIKIHNKSYIKLDFVAWETGKINFPSLKDIGINFEFPSIYVSSILELDKNISLQEARPPLLLHGTTYLIYSYVFSFFILCFLLASFVIWIRKKRKSIIKTLSQKYAIFIFYFTLKNLKGKLKHRVNVFSLEERNIWVKKYEVAFRLFLSSMYKTKENWVSFTYSEIVEAINDPNKEILSLIKSIFENLSFIRFANISDEAIPKKIIDYSFKLISLYR